MIDRQDESQTPGTQSSFTQNLGIRQNDDTDSHHHVSVAEHLKPDSQLPKTRRIAVAPTYIVTQRVSIDLTRSTSEGPPIEWQFERFRGD